MPYPNYNQLCEEDLYSIVAYIKSLQPKENKVPERELKFPLNFLIKTMNIERYTPKEAPPKSDKISYGKYVLTIASCRDCHSPSVEGEPVPGMDLAGGTEMKLPWGTIRPANLTPDKETGIGSWTKEDFINRFKYYDTDSTRNIPVKMTDFNSIMPWTLYAGMNEEDLGAIYDYLQTVKPVKNRVLKWSPPRESITKK
jgi:hypothetical protein